jgi:ferrous iron transport protein B
MAAIRQEASRKWMWFSVLWSFLIAYAAAAFFYQLAFFSEHPLVSLGWIFLMIAILGAFICILYYFASTFKGKYAASGL